MKFIHTLEAAQSQEARTWAMADGLVLDFSEAGVTDPTALHFKEATEALAAKGLDYDQKTIRDYWRVGSVFRGPKRRRATATVKVYSEIVNALWARLPAETRSNDLVSYATQFFASVAAPKGRALPGAYKARAWAKSMAASLDAERKAREDAEAKRQATERLTAEEAAMAEALAVGDMKRARKILPAVNALRARLGMDLVDLDEETKEVTKDPKATKQAQEEAEAEALNAEARTEIEYAIARTDSAAAFLANTFLRVQEHLTLDDRDAYADEIGLTEGRLALIRSQFSGTTSDDALAAALAEWESDTTSS